MFLKDRVRFLQAVTGIPNQEKEEEQARSKELWAE